MIEATFIDRRMDGVELYELLHKHRLLPKTMEDPAVCIAMAGSSDVGFRLETLPWGIRSCQTYGNHMESMAVLSMLPGDPAKVYVPFEQKDTTLSNVG